MESYPLQQGKYAVMMSMMTCVGISTNLTSVQLTTSKASLIQFISMVTWLLGFGLTDLSFYPLVPLSVK